MNQLTSLKIWALILVGCLCIPALSFAQNLKIATAANLQSVIKVLGADFTKKTGIITEPIIGSSGNLTTQILNGAPYDIFLSADMEFPQKLYDAGFSLQKPVTYAKGSLIICSIRNINFNNWEKLLLTGTINKIAIANPDIAPYGRATIEALKHKNINDKVQRKLVTGESISQVNTYITTGVADVGFTTQALVKDIAGKQTVYWKAIDPKTYTPIEQGIVVLKRANGNTNAEKFYRYILSADAKRIFKEYGYIVD